MLTIRRAMLVVFYFFITTMLAGCKLTLLQPKGIVALDERNILFVATGLMLLVILPVIILTVLFAFRYNSKKDSTYKPEWCHNGPIEIVCWGIPCIIISILAYITWTSSHRLDPYRPLDLKGKPLQIEAIALEWKWLFIYPEQNIATVNFMQIPVNRPIELLITSEGPMNSLQIPALAGQVYAMAGMQTKLHLNANVIGDYRGFSANFSGDGFSDMNFVTRASSEKDFNKWVKNIKLKSHHSLTQAAYHKLMKPSENNPAQYYRSANQKIFITSIMKSMMPMKKVEKRHA